MFEIDNNSSGARNSWGGKSEEIKNRGVNTLPYGEDSLSNIWTREKMKKMWRQKRFLRNKWPHLFFPPGAATANRYSYVIETDDESQSMSSIR